MEILHSLVKISVQTHAYIQTKQQKDKNTARKTQLASSC